MNSPKIGILDIETSAMEALVWGRKDVNIGVDMITKDWEIIAWSFKWLGQKKVTYYDTRKHSESVILIALRNLLDEADIVVTQNGQSFDSRKINARLIYYGIKPPSPYRHMDTYRIARRVGDFTSYGLDYLTRYFKTKHQKLKHSKFRGISLWKECAQGNKEAWAEMKRYNINDTLATEELYMKLRAWAPDSCPKPYSSSLPADLSCDTCGYKGVMTKWGFYRANSGVWARFACPHCGSFRKGAKIK